MKKRNQTLVLHVYEGEVKEDDYIFTVPEDIIVGEYNIRDYLDEN